MAKIAVELDQALIKRTISGAPGSLTARVLAQGDGWRVADVICTSGLQDRAFEEHHQNVSIAMVLAGSFQYRSGASFGFMTPGSLLLGNSGQYFECGHEHGAGDRCLSFQFDPNYFQNLAAEAQIDSRFQALRVPPLRALSSLVARACANLSLLKGPGYDEHWEEMSLQIMELASRLSSDSKNQSSIPPSAIARVTRVVRWIERDWHEHLTLRSMAREAKFSLFHFLRVFEQITGLTPHQYLLRTRLREAAIKLTSKPTKILDVALDCGFGDISNFNRNFRAEFGVSPRIYRAERRLQS